MEKKLKVGIIGAGVISSYHMNAYQNNPYAQLKAVCAGHIESAKRQADAYGVEKYCTDYLLACGQPPRALSVQRPSWRSTSSLTRGSRTRYRRSATRFTPI